MHCDCHIHMTLDGSDWKAALARHKTAPDEVFIRATLKNYQTLGIGHTRWATHGEPNDINSHPHLSQNGKIALVHNGIIENYLEIRTFLEEKGVKFVSQTDSEVVAQLLEYCLGLPETNTVPDAIYMVLHRIEGAYAFGIVCAARKPQPMESTALPSVTSSICTPTFQMSPLALPGVLMSVVSCVI